MTHRHVIIRQHIDYAIHDATPPVLSGLPADPPPLPLRLHLRASGRQMSGTEKGGKGKGKKGGPAAGAKAKDTCDPLGIEAKKATNFPNWYTQVITRAERLHYYDLVGQYAVNTPLPQTLSSPPAPPPPPGPRITSLRARPGPLPLRRVARATDVLAPGTAGTCTSTRCMTMH